MYKDVVQQQISIPYYVNMQTTYLGLDSKEHCFDQSLFNRHPTVYYSFNEVGFRTHPVDKFQRNAILALGDSFTLGLGSNIEDRYTDIIEQKLSHQVLNFSLNGASNSWISRKLEQLLKVFDPKAIIIHYTFSHRRERPELDWQDDERTECEPRYSSQENYQDWHRNFDKIRHLASGAKLVHSFIPNWHDSKVDYAGMMPPIIQTDYARDGFHYGPKTQLALAEKITSLLGA